MKRILISTIAGAMLCAFALEAKVAKNRMVITGRHQLETITEKHELVVIYAYRPTAATQPAIDNVRNIFGQFARKLKYRDTVIFATMNLLQNGLQSVVAKQFPLPATGDLILFFESGELVAQKAINSSGFTPAQLTQFLDENDIDEQAAYLQRKQERAEQKAARADRDEERRSERRRYYYDRPRVGLSIGTGPYWGGWGWGSPYWGGGWGWGRPAVGFGISI